MILTEIGDLIEYQTEEGKWITQSYPTYFHTFNKKIIQKKNENSDNWIEITDSLKLLIELSDSEFISPPLTFIDLWNKSCDIYGKYNTQTGFFELNELTDITYEEALAIYSDGTFDSFASGGKQFVHRTNLPITARHSTGTIAESFNSDNFVMNVEVANLKSLYVTHMGFSAYPISIYSKPFGYAKLRKIIGDIDFHFAKDRINWFVEAVNLEEVSITRLAFSIDLSSCGKLNLQSFQTMVDTAYSTNQITITVHPDIYNKLINDENWNQILISSLSKNITFITK